MAAKDIPGCFVSIDVECVATGKGHSDRAPCWLGAVNSVGKVLMDEIMQVKGPIASPLTELTGVTREIIDKRGIPFDKARAKLIAILGPKSVIVGQRPQGDIKWM